jgi:hypothetical protein
VAFAGGGLLMVACRTGMAADDSALLNALLREGVLSQGQVDRVRADLDSQGATTDQGLLGKIKTPGAWVEEIDLYGDLRLRDYFVQQQQQLPAPPSSLLHQYDSHIQQNRFRFRLRLNADFKLAGGFFGGVQLSTSDNRDAATQNATYTGGYDNYNIYISRAFMGWQPTDGLTFVAGRQDNPFYTTSDFFWGVDYGLNGIVERLDLHKFVNLTFGASGFGDEAVAGGAAKQAVAAERPPANELQLSLIAGQFIFFHNNQNLNFNQGKDDAYQFETQLLTRLKLWGGKLTITEAPGIWIANSATLGTTKLLSSTQTLGLAQNGIFNTATFRKGQPDPTALVNFGSIPASPGTGTGTLGSLNNLGAFPISQRDELFILSPGDITYKLGQVPLMFYWDFSYNVWGDARFNDVYGPLFSKVTFVKSSAGVTPVFSNRAQPSLQDNLAWLVGLKVGKNDRAGDFSLSVDYRRIGIDSMDPNINTDDFGESNLNAEGFRFSAAVNLTDFMVLGFTGWFSWNVNNLYGGYATGPFFPIANANSNQVFAVDLGLKF